MINLIHVSDIHFSQGRMYENQEFVIKSFLKDIQEQIKGCDPERTIFTISGDLVFTGMESYYTEFFDNFILPITQKCKIPLCNIIFAPGNHDASKHHIESEWRYFKNQRANNDETEQTFNDFINGNSLDLIHYKNKFQAFYSFCIEKMKHEYSPLGEFSKTYFDKIDIYCLNSALCTCVGYEQTNDAGLLHINTRKLYKWLENDNGKYKILIMHHPITQLSQWAQNSLKPFLEQGRINLLLTGHIHENQTNTYNPEYTQNNILLSSPQLFSNKNDLQGYSIIQLDENDSQIEIKQIKYRQWSTNSQKFLLGVDYAGNDSGKKVFKKDNATNITLQPKLQEKPHDNINYTDLINALDNSKFEDTYEFIKTIRLIEQLKVTAETNVKYQKDIFDAFIRYIKRRLTTSPNPFVKEQEWLSLTYKEKLTKLPAFDIQLIFNILYNDNKEIFKAWSADFKNTNLINIDLIGLEISNADFSHCLLEHASTYIKTKQTFSFNNCIFNETYLDAANMTNNIFNNCKFNNSYFRWANLYGCKFNHITFDNCDFTGSIFSNSKFKGCHFSNCIFDGSEFNDIHFLSKTDFKHSSFCFASIFSEKMHSDSYILSYEDCDFSGAETDKQTFFEKHGRIKRMICYQKNITNTDKIGNKCGYIDENHITYKRMKYIQILNTMKKYCVENSSTESDEIKKLLENKYSEI